MSTTQPIALPNSQPNFQDYTMAEGSYTGSSGSFNPASYARHFLGSPISWRQGSFGSRIHSGSPSAQFFSSIDCNDLKYSKVSSSIESDRGSILNALNVFDREGELCRNYTCCGLHLNDMHALVEHLEEVHFGAYHSNPPHTQTQVQAPYNTQPIQPDYSIATPAQVPTHNHTSVATSHLPTGPSYPTSFDSDDMEFELELETSAPAPQVQSSAHSSPSSNATTPPDTPITTPLSAYPAHTFPNAHLTLPQSNIHSPYASQPASPLASHDSSAYASAASTAASTRHPSPTGTSSRPNLNLNLSAFQRSNQYNTSSPSILTNPEEAFNPYARFSSDYSSCMPGAQYNPADVNEASALHANWPQHQGGAANAGQCVPPALLFSSSASNTPISTPDGSRVPSPTTSGYGGSRSLSQCSAPTTPSRTSPPSSIGNSASGRSSSSRSAAASTLSRPASSLLLSKPFRCPKPNCNKSYKQANGLKYHITHGSCNFAPPKDLEHVKDLLERKRRDREREREKLGEAGGDSSSGPLGRSMSLGNIGESYDDSQDLSSIMSNISEAELREVEREAEKRMKPFACGVGDCQRRYKNMNGLRYHYQHSGDHGAVGLALLASGQHECLQGQKRGQHHQSATSGTQGPDGDKDGRRRSIQSPSRGSASMPVSRATSRTGTPQPLPQQPPNQQVPAQHYSPMNANVSVPGGINALGMTQAQPFTPPQANASQAATTQQLQSHQVDTQTQQQIFHHQYAQLHQQHYQQYAHAMAAQQQQQSPQQQHMMQGLYSSSIEMS
ncbi:hypothetical protein AMATHDRAFT_2227 [Amanita thiersii Skay4041]|uniref:C2H2-type domain-containing protein n=1 Tax=Amanita thiersii Skay4041 TaxID=703135 RepID=A0A2A9NW11_9AGAR|nr:hypothetical protein AMATHDRAFT_2227 [Amanita thiersii Skay4041]